MQHLYKYSIALVTGLILIPFSGLGQNQEKFRARISPIPIDVAMQKVVAGTGAATATLSGNKLTITGVFEGMPSAATTAKIHRGLATGVRGSPFLDLTVTKATQGSISGSFDLTPEQVRYLEEGKLYIQIYSEKAPDGTLWGWILKP